MEITSITTLSVTQLQSRLAQTLRWASRTRQAILLTHWHQPTHVILPLAHLPASIRQLLEQLPQEADEMAQETLCPMGGCGNGLHTAHRGAL
ncbi:hypothetical protein [Trichloromonas sp.]|uniref:hypothetical protein n=1 Tax=Trichloromonas sp. TaxID=3069249 RepID=UPI001E153812|nr:hypothetical protein [Desulfuromonadaceae bacterium]MDY0269069.1 hypothetical protein [Trichloromonas sp.]